MALPRWPVIIRVRLPQSADQLILFPRSSTDLKFYRPERFLLGFASDFSFSLIIGPKWISWPVSRVCYWLFKVHWSLSQILFVLSSPIHRFIYLLLPIVISYECSLLLRLYTLTILLRVCCLTAGYRLTKYNSIHYSTRTDPRLAPYPHHNHHCTSPIGILFQFVINIIILF